MSAYLAGQVSTIAELNFRDALTVSTLTAAAVWLLLTVVSTRLLAQARKQHAFYKVSHKSR